MTQSSSLAEFSPLASSPLAEFSLWASSPLGEFSHWASSPLAEFSLWTSSPLGEFSFGRVLLSFSPWPSSLSGRVPLLPTSRIQNRVHGALRGYCTLCLVIGDRVNVAMYHGSILDHLDFCQTGMLVLYYRAAQTKSDSRTYQLLQHVLRLLALCIVSST